MQNAQKPDHRNLLTILNWLKEGRFVIPDFQREFEWYPWDINALVRSIFLDYYIGSLLLWRGKEENFEALSCEPVYGWEGHEEGNRDYIVLDGQQRLTALYYAFHAPDVRAPKRKSRYLYFIDLKALREDRHDEAFIYDWKQHGLIVLQNQEAQFKEHWFPLALIGKDSSGYQLHEWTKNYERYWQEHGDQDAAAFADSFGKLLYEVLSNYQIVFIELDQDVSIEKICDIFTQINSRGIRLDIFDLLNALLKPKGIQLKQLWRQAKDRLDFVTSDRLNIYVLQTISIALQAYCSPRYLYYLIPGQKRGSHGEKVLIQDTETFIEQWHSAVSAMEKAVTLLRDPREYGAVTSNLLPYTSILPVFSVLHETAEKLPVEERFKAKTKIRLWYWSSVFTNRYSGSVESTAARDYLELKRWFNEDSAKPQAVTEFAHSAPYLDLKRETNRVSAIYKGVLNLVAIKGARDWIGGGHPSYELIDDHHIVPRSWGMKNNVANIDTVLNRTLLAPETNRNIIADKLPNEYLPELIERNGRAAVQQILSSHLVSEKALEILLRQPFTPDDFTEFINEREKTIRNELELLLMADRLSNGQEISPPIQILDADIETIERKLRNLISEILQGNPNLLPQHVRDKIDRRLQNVTKKNPSRVGDFQSLADLLELADLRELQDVLQAKSIWPQVAPVFGGKETLIKRFGQLAELRNAIRHSRRIDPVVRKEAEAAILWFKETLRI